MLDEFKENEFYKYAVNLKNYYHAYIFEVDDIEDSYNIVLAFAKMIICKDHYTNNSNCNNCNICHLIDSGYYEDLKVIEPDGKMIKKEQVQLLQNDFSLKSSNNNNRVYIIKDADKMNSSSSNSLLKFIEEPNEKIYGILITTNINDLLTTIISRCEIIKLKSNKKFEFDDSVLTNSLNFIKLINTYKEDSIAYLKRDFFSYFKDREEILTCFNYLINSIDIVINIRHGININNQDKYDIIINELEKIEINDLLYYLDRIIFYKNRLVDNPYLNLNLFMDMFIIDISKVVLK